MVPLNVHDVHVWVANKYRKQPDLAKVSGGLFSLASGMEEGPGGTWRPDITKSLINKLVIGRKQEDVRGVKEPNRPKNDPHRK